VPRAGELPPDEGGDLRALAAGQELDAADASPHAASKKSVGRAAIWTAVALAAAALGAFVYPPGIVVGVTSSGPQSLIGNLVAGLPFGYAFAAGMVSAANPCGLPLLPGYLGLYLADAGRPGRLARALAVSLTLTVTFVAVFALAGASIALTRSALGLYFGWLGLATGLALVFIGGALLGGVPPHWRAAQSLGSRLADSAGRRSVVGYVAYGVAFAVCSLSCTLPIFLAVVGSAVTGAGGAGAILQMALYALGMALVISMLTFATALFRQVAIGSVRRLGARLEPAWAVLLLATGAYVTYYWLAAVTAT
jgi:cytochrome c biogenesis protein CcdA